MFEKKTKMKDKAVPFAAGAAVTAGAIVGVAAAKALSDKKNRKKIAKEFNSAKKQVVATMTDMVEKRGDMMDMVVSKAKDVLPKKAQNKAVKKVSVAKKAVEKKDETVAKGAQKKTASASRTVRAKSDDHLPTKTTVMDTKKTSSTSSTAN